MKSLTFCGVGAILHFLEAFRLPGLVVREGDGENTTDVDISQVDMFLKYTAISLT